MVEYGRLETKSVALDGGELARWPSRGLTRGPVSCAFRASSPWLRLGEKGSLFGSVTTKLSNRYTTTMARQFFVGGNFKMNPASRAQKTAIVDRLNDAELDPNTGACLARCRPASVQRAVCRGRDRSALAVSPRPQGSRQAGHQGRCPELLL